MKIINEEHFGIARKIVANMTSESWETIPHTSFIYEPDVSAFLDLLKQINSTRSKDEHITINTAIMRVIIEGIKANPQMNSHIEFNRQLVRGTIKTFEEINVSMPMILPTGEMMTVNLHNLHNKSMTEISELIKETQEKAKNTDMNEAMFEVSLDNTLEGLKDGKVVQTVNRLVGSKTGKYKVHTLEGEEKKEYYSIPESERLTKHDIEQGTITISNFGSVYRGKGVGTCTLLEIVPPQVVAIAVGSAQDKPLVVTDDNGNKSISIRQTLPLTIAFDHRALDYGDCVNFMEKLDEIFADPKVILNWI